MPTCAAAEPARRDAFRTADPDEAHDRAQRLMTEHRMVLGGARQAFLADVGSDVFDGFGVMRFDYGAPVRIVSAALRDFMTVHVPLAGDLAVRYRGDATHAHPGCAAIFSSDGEVDMRWSAGLRLMVLKLDRPDLERRLSTLLGGPVATPLRFDVAAPLAGQSPLAAAIGMLREAFAAAGPAGPSPVLRAELKNAVLTALLLGQRHSHTDAIFTPRQPPAPRVLRQALELIHDGEAGWTAAGLAGAVGVSERSLYEAFRRRFGVSPAAYLRRERLERVRAELLAGPDAGIADVAARHGFGHPGRFAAAYRARFGELPSETVRRA